MKKLIASISILVLFSFPVNAQTANHVVVSEVYGGGGNSGSTWKNDFVELYNPTSSPVTLAGWSVQYASATGTSWQVTNLVGSIPAYGFFLVQQAQGTGGTQNLPTPDVIGIVAMSGTAGKIALVNTTTALSGANPSDGSIVDKVGYGATANGFEGAGPTPAPSNTSSVERKAQSTSAAPSLASGSDALLGNGYDSGNNADDFVAQSAINPQNSSSTTETPPGGGPVVGGDTNPPTVLSVRAISDILVEVAFNEPVDSLTSSNAANYSIDKSISVSQATRSKSVLSKVNLTVSTMANGSYTLTIQNVKDTAGNVMSSAQLLSFSYGTLTIAQARAAGVGVTVRVKGVITVSNQFGSPSYIQDSTAGLAVFSSAFSNNAKVGDIWEVGGTLKNFNGLLEIDPISDTVRISSGNPTPPPIVLRTKQLGETYEGRLIRINKLKFDSAGFFSGNANYIARDADSGATIRIVNATGIPLSPIPADSVNIVGVLGEFNGIYQLMPRSISDIGVIDPPSNQTWMDIITARGQPDNSKVTVRGIVTFSQPSATTARTVFIQDGTAGIALYHSSTDTLVIGDSVEVRGILAPYRNFLELNPIDSLVLFARGLSLPQPKLIRIATVSESYEGQLVRLTEVQFVETGVFADGTSGMTYHLTDGSIQLDVRIPKNSALTATAIPVGALEITGLLGQFDARYQVIPRTAADLVQLPGPQIVSQPVITNLTDNGFTVGWSTLLDGTSTLYYGATQSLGDSIVGQTASKTHSFSLTGLRPGRVYYFRGVSSSATGTSSSSIVSAVTTSSASTGEIQVYFNYSTDGTLGLTPAANANVALLGKLLERISKATKTIDMALYSFDDFSSNSGVVANRVADSLLSAKNRGVTVRMVFDNKSTTTPLGKLVAGGISVIKRSVPGTDNGIMHNKFFVFDGRDTTSATDDWVITGSWNVTNEGTLVDAQNAVFIQDQSLARIYTLEFEEMFGSSTTTGNSGSAKFGPMKQNNTPHWTYVGGRKVEVYFSPSDQTTSKIIGALSSADQNIFFGIMSFTRTDIAGTLLARKNAGVLVRGMIDQQPSVLSTLQAGGVDALQAGHSVVTGLFHHKYSIVDPFNDASDPLVITGSHNWSSNAENDNDENTLIIHSGDIARQYVQEFSKRYKESGGSGQVLGVEQIGSTVPAKFGLSQNYPNPFNPRTEIRVQIAEASIVSLKVYDVLGREVATFFDESKAPGVYAVSWNASRMSSGVYLYRLQARPTDNSKGTGFVETRKMILTK